MTKDNARIRSAVAYTTATFLCIGATAAMLSALSTARAEAQLDDLSFETLEGEIAEEPLSIEEILGSQIRARADAEARANDAFDAECRASRPVKIGKRKYAAIFMSCPGDETNGTEEI